MWARVGHEYTLAVRYCGTAHCRRCNQSRWYVTLQEAVRKVMCATGIKQTKCQDADVKPHMHDDWNQAHRPRLERPRFVAATHSTSKATCKSVRVLPCTSSFIYICILLATVQVNVNALVYFVALHSLHLRFALAISDPRSHIPDSFYLALLRSFQEVAPTGKAPGQHFVTGEQAA